ncbi:hypothetical protein E3N88_17434 [Mikania micrantha]|uniref:Calcium-transporting P-type ATPase N-terminal autoinhibitory domain-containing protein n=1 Tax=Mikania micrantha TaxID=192012 RepID=A0A5N6NUL9_9ASTR|nr:hypothetical protein E3N88_17434 [Mikania micrantha]
MPLAEHYALASLRLLCRSARRGGANMNDYLKDFDVPAKRPSDAALKKWRDAVSLVRNHRLRFRHVADLEKRSVHQNRLRKIKVITTSPSASSLEGTRISERPLSMSLSTCAPDHHDHNTITIGPWKIVGPWPLSKIVGGKGVRFGMKVDIMF